MKIIQHKEPKSFIYKNKIALIAFVFIGLIVSFIGLGYLLGIIFIATGAIFLEEKYDKTFDGWTIKENEIELHRLNLFRWKETLVLKYSDVKNLNYVKPGAYSPLLFVFDLGLKRENLNPRMSIFKCAFILKILKEKGVPIKFDESDEEVEFYVNGLIETIPIKKK